MKMRSLGSTGPSVSSVCLGTMTFGTPVAEAKAIELTHWALDHGINFIDTANMYEGYARFVGSPGGVAEEILGKALRGRRDMVVLATKAGNKVGDAPEDSGTSPIALRAQLDRSLKRLRTDHVDIYYLHKPDPATPLLESLATMQQLIRQGKVRTYGVSNYPAPLLEELLKTADANGLPRPIVHQPPYSLLKRDVEADLLPLCLREIIAVVPYQVLQGGLLTGKYKRGGQPPPDSRKSEKSDWLPELDAALYDRLEQIEAEAEAKGRSMMTHAIAAILEHPAVASIIVGVKRPDQLATLIAAANEVHIS